MLFIEELKESGKPGGPANPFDTLLGRKTTSSGGPAKLTREYKLAKQESKRKYDAGVVARRTYNDRQHVAASQYYAQQRKIGRARGSGFSMLGTSGPRLAGGATIREKLNMMEAADDIRSRFPQEVLKEKSRQRQIDRDDWDRRRRYKLEQELDKDYRNSLSQPPESIPRATGQTAYDLIGNYNERIINPLGDDYSIDPIELLPEIYE